MRAWHRVILAIEAFRLRLDSRGGDVVRSGISGRCMGRRIGNSIRNLRFRCDRLAGVYRWELGRRLRIFGGFNRIPLLGRCPLSGHLPTIRRFFLSRWELSSHLLRRRIVDFGNTGSMHVDHGSDHPVGEMIFLQGADEGITLLTGIVETGVREIDDKVFTPVGELQDLPDLSRVSLLADLDGLPSGFVELEPFPAHHKHAVADGAGHGIGPRDLLLTTHLRDTGSGGLHPLRIHDGDVERIVRKL